MTKVKVLARGSPSIVRLPAKTTFALNPLAPLSVHEAPACTVMASNRSKLLAAVPVPSSTSLLVAPVRALPSTTPFRIEPVSSVSVFAPTSAKVIAKAPPLMVPALVTEPSPPS